MPAASRKEREEETGADLLSVGCDGIHNVDTVRICNWDCSCGTSLNVE